MFTKTLSVSAVNNYIKKIIENDFILNNISIKGEISNFKAHSSGHLYFSLKDDKGKINCIMFRNYAETLKFIPKDGKTVVVRGRISVYEKDGAYQIYIQEMKEEGLGELYAAFLELKDKLEKQGLFHPDKKLPIPEYPRKVGVITSPTGAAVRDIINVARRRNPFIPMVIYPSLVQGENASEEIIKGIDTLNKMEDVDVIILARGGGSIEELWAFNNEALAYSIFKSKKPIITGVGHETDFTISDFVSARRAPTPSAAAELAFPSINEIYRIIDNYKSRLNSLITGTLNEKYSKVQVLSKTLSIYSPVNFILNQYNYIDNLQHKLTALITNNIALKKAELSKAQALLQAHNPLNVLSKGYSIVENLDGRVITKIEHLKDNSTIKIILKDGAVRTDITNLKKL